jgi:hypothetical protein
MQSASGSVLPEGVSSSYCSLLSAVSFLHLHIPTQSKAEKKRAEKSEQRRGEEKRGREQRK